MKYCRLSQNNKGASLVIIIAVMALFMVLAMNILMAANVTSNDMSNEYDHDRVNLYVSSVFKTIDSKVCSGEIPGVFKSAGDTVESANELTFDGFRFDDTNVTVKAKAIKYGSAYGEIWYEVYIGSKTYKLTGRYILSKVGKDTVIMSDGCSGIEQVL